MINSNCLFFDNVGRDDFTDVFCVGRIVPAGIRIRLIRRIHPLLNALDRDLRNRLLFFVNDTALERQRELLDDRDTVDSRILQRNGKILFLIDLPSRQ